MRILLDECVPWPMHTLLVGHDCATAQQRGWGGAKERRSAALTTPTRKWNLDVMSISGHDLAMKKAKVSDLKTHLSAYLAEVRRGRSVIVCDRTTPIARLVPYEPNEDDGFTVIPASLPIGDLKKVRAVRPQRALDVVRLLREDRDAR